MLTKTRSDFWKCACNIQPCTTDKCSECEVSQFYGDDATNVEALVAWLLADDERRREIEIASRPTKAGEYTLYRFGKKQTLMSISKYASQPDINRDLWKDDTGLWEPLSE